MLGIRTRHGFQINARLHALQTVIPWLEGLQVDSNSRTILWSRFRVLFFFSFYSFPFTFCGNPLILPINLKLLGNFFFLEGSEQLLLFAMDLELSIKSCPRLDTLTIYSVCSGDSSLRGSHKPENKWGRARAEWKWVEGVETLILKRTGLVLSECQPRPSHPGLTSWVCGWRSHPLVWVRGLLVAMGLVGEGPLARGKLGCVAYCLLACFSLGDFA